METSPQTPNEKLLDHLASIVAFAIVLCGGAILIGAGLWLLDWLCELIYFFSKHTGEVLILIGAAILAYELTGYVIRAIRRAWQRRNRPRLFRVSLIGWYLLLTAAFGCAIVSLFMICLILSIVSGALLVLAIVWHILHNQFYQAHLNSLQS